jgi:hypothetical protein
MPKGSRHEVPLDSSDIKARHLSPPQLRRSCVWFLLTLFYWHIPVYIVLNCDYFTFHYFSAMYWPGSSNSGKYVWGPGTGKVCMLRTSCLQGHNFKGKGIRNTFRPEVFLFALLNYYWLRMLMTACSRERLKGPVLGSKVGNEAGRRATEARTPSRRGLSATSAEIRWLNIDQHYKYFGY